MADFRINITNNVDNTTASNYKNAGGPIVTKVVSNSIDGTTLYLTFYINPDADYEFNDFTDLKALKEQFPRVILQQELDETLKEDLEKFSKDDFHKSDKLFLLDPYGRAVMYYELETIDPKKLLKDLKVLI